MHFHTPSEHKIQGRRYLLEAHFVNMSADKQILVVGVLFKRDDDTNKTLDTILNQAPAKSQEKVDFKGAFNINDFLPKDKDSFYAYMGSLTTPPCSENVQWIIINKEKEVTHNQMVHMRSVLGEDNDRRLQQRNGRNVILYEENNHHEEHDDRH